MPRYTDADKLIKDISSVRVEVVGGRAIGKTIFLEALNLYHDKVLELVKEAPTEDVVEVVRCKDCKHFGKDLGYGKHDCKKYEMPYCLENDYCSYGERKE